MSLFYNSRNIPIRRSHRTLDVRSRPRPRDEGGYPSHRGGGRRPELLQQDVQAVGDGPQALRDEARQAVPDGCARAAPGLPADVLLES